METQKWFVLTPDQVRSSTLIALVESLSEAQRTIKIETVDPDQNMYAGDTQAPWKIQGWNQSVEVTILFRKPVNEDLTIVSIRLKLIVNGHSLNFICEEPEESLVFECDSPHLSAVYPSLGGIISLNCFISNNGLPSFIQSTNLRYQLSIRTGEVAVTSHQWISDQTDLVPTFWSATSLSSPIESLVLINELFSTNESDNHPINYRLRGEFFLGKICNVEIRPFSDRQLIIDLSAEGGLPSLVEIADSLKLGGLHQELGQFYEHFPGLNQLTINRIRLMVATDRLAILKIELFGAVELFEVTFNFSLSYPRFHFQTQLSSLTPIPLGKLLHQWFPVGTGLPESVKINALVFNLQSSPLSIRMNTTVSDLWEFEIGPTPIQLKAINFGFTKNTDGIRGHVSASLTIGQIDFQLLAGNDDPLSGYLFQTKMAHQTGISLTDLVLELSQLFHIEAPKSLPQITLEQVDISFHTQSHQFELSAHATLHQKVGPIDKGAVQFQLDLTKNQSGAFTFECSLSTNIELEQTRIFGEATFSASALKFDFQWTKHEGEGLHLTHLLSAIDHDFDPATVPTEVEHLLTLSMISVAYDSDSKEFSGELRTEGGLELFIAGRSGKDGGLLAGIGYHQPDEMPLFGEHLAGLQQTVHLSDLWLVLNTFEKGNQLPQLPDAFPSVVSKNLKNEKFSLLATLDLEKSRSHAGLAEVAKQSPHSELTVVGALLNDGISIKADLLGGISFPLKKTGERENQLTLEGCYLEFSVSKTGFNFELGAAMQFEIDHMPLHPSFRLSVSEKALRTAGRIQFGDGQHGGWNIFGLNGVEIQEIALLLGVEFASAGLEFGLFGKIQIAAIEPGDTGNFFDFGIILEMHGELPNLQYFALSIQKVDFTQLLKALFFKGREAPAINTTLKGEDLSIYMAQSVVKLPDGTKTNPGFGLHGLITIFDWKAYAHLDAHPDSGIRGDLQLSPIVSDWFSLTGESDAVEVNGYIDPATNNWVTLRNAGETVPNDVKITKKELVEAGGPMLHLDTTASPYLAASVHVRLLKFVTADLDIRVRDELLDFNVHFAVTGLADFRLHCSLKNGKELSAKGSFFAGVKIDFSDSNQTIQFEIGFSMAMELHVGPELKDFKLTLSGSIDFMGSNIDVVSLNVNDFPNDAVLLPTWLGTQFSHRYLPGLEATFRNAYNELKARTDRFNEAAYSNAKELLDKTTAWVKFVDDDIQEMQQEKTVSFLNASVVADRINKQCDEIERQVENLQASVREKRPAELAHLEQLERVTGIHSENQLDRINRATTNQMINMQREIAELRDDDKSIRNAILALWKQTSIVPFETLSPQEQSEAISSQRDAVDALLPILMVTTPTTNQELYPNEKGKFLPRAVEHHAHLIALDKQSSVHTAAIVAQAIAEAAVIIARAQQDNPKH